MRKAKILLALALVLTACTTARAAVPVATVAMATGETPAAVLVTPTPTPQVATVASWGLRVRACPGVACAVVDWLHQGDRVTLAGQPVRTNDGGTWAPVRTTAGLAGWVNAKYLNLERLP